MDFGVKFGKTGSIIAVFHVNVPVCTPPTHCVPYLKTANYSSDGFLTAIKFSLLLLQ